jgi:hypothetical protein
MPQRLSVRRFQEGGRADYRVQDTTDYLRSLKSPTGIIGRDTLAALPVSVRDRIRDKLAVVIGRDNADKAMLPVEMLLDPILAGNEARLAADKGNYGEAALGAALAALPIPVPAKKSIKASADAAKSAMKKGAKKTDAPALAVKPDVMEPLAVRPQIAIRTKPSGIIAYHGSPLTFHRFDMSKIGTGAGNQSYGHGLYFAENEAVAKEYREKLTQYANRASGGFADPNKMYETVKGQIAYGHPDYYAAKLLEQMRSLGVGEDWLKREIWMRGLGDYGGYQKIMRGVKKLKEGDVSKVQTPGSMYQVRIDADPNDFLDWYAPLSGQSERVRGAVERTYPMKGWQGDTVSLADIAKLFRDGGLDPARIAQMQMNAQSAYVDIGRHLGSQADASKKLRGEGVKGIKYPDQGSRIVGDGSRNFVVFDDDLVNILKRYRDGGLAVKKKKPRVSKRKALPQSSPNSSM